MAYIGNFPAAGSVTGDNILDGSIETVDIKNSAVTAVKLSSTAVTDKLGFTPANKAGETFSGNLEIAYNGFPSLKYKDGSGSLKGEMYMGTTAGDWNLVVNGATRLTCQPDGLFQFGDQSHGVGIKYINGSTLPSIAGAFTSSSGWGQGYGDLILKARSDYGGFYNIIFATAGSNNTPVERMRISSAGYVTTPNRPAFAAAVDGGSENAEITNYDFTDQNVGSHWNATTGRFTAPVAGTYFFAASVMGDATSTYHYFRFMKNGGQLGPIFHSHSNSTEGYRSVAGSYLLSLSAGDYVSIYLYASKPYSSGPAPWSSFCGFLVG